MDSKVFNTIVTLLFFPEADVLLEKLDDGLGISESFLVNIVDLFKGLRKCIFTKSAGFGFVTNNFVFEDTVVQSETKSNWVAGV